jgi:energy-coupling factor transporter transmembrane protein EcfT
MSRLLSYIPRQSPVHFLDPRTKMLWVLLCTLLAWYLRHPLPMLVLLLSLISYWVIGQVAEQGWRFLKAIFPLLIFSFVM